MWTAIKEGSSTQILSENLVKNKIQDRNLGQNITQTSVLRQGQRSLLFQSDKQQNTSDVQHEKTDQHVMRSPAESHLINIRSEMVDQGDSTLDSTRTMETREVRTSLHGVTRSHGSSFKSLTTRTSSGGEQQMIADSSLSIRQGQSSNEFNLQLHVQNRKLPHTEDNVEVNRAERDEPDRRQTVRMVGQENFTMSSQSGLSSDPSAKLSSQIVLPQDTASLPSLCPTSRHSNNNVHQTEAITASTPTMLRAFFQTLR